MLWLSNIRIGTKLAVMSGLGILLVVGMMLTVMHSNSSVREANEAALTKTEISRDIQHIKALGRGMQLAVRDVRLAISKEELQKAFVTLGEQHNGITSFIDPVIAKFRLEENRERARKLKGLFDQYASAAKEFEPLKTELLDLQAKQSGGNTADVSARIAVLNDQLIMLARERTLPIVAQAEEMLGQIDAIASQLAEQETENAAEAMTSGQRLGMGVGLLTVVLLIGSAFLGAFSIARPLGKIASVLHELTQDSIVDVPYANRGDEVGDIAKATEVFKQSIAEKVINLRVRSGLDVVRSNVMIADDGYNIMYMNGTLKEMLREAEAELRKVLPAFDSSKLIGANMDVFHKNPAHQRKMLEHLTGSIETHITVGTQKFHLVATAVVDQHGKRAGTVVEWRNETVEKAIEGEIDDIVKSAVAGDFSKRVPVEGKNGFMLNLATAMNGLCGNVAKALDDLARMLSALAEGDLTQRITAEYEGAFSQLKNDANTMAERIGKTIAEIKLSAREVTNASAEISTSTTDLSQRTEEQAASLEETSASMEEISATVKKNAENAQQANQFSAETREVAERGGAVVGDAVGAMARIEESSRKISDIIGVIDEIARQTNLLALNAAVEAARAGEAGRGFAVVATEVRSLAQRSSQAAKDIKELITNSSGQVKDGVDLVNRAGTSLTEIVASIKKVAGIVSDIAAASAEQATGLEQINKALAQMDEVTQQNSALVEENAATAKTLEHQATAMDERVSFFRLDDDAASAEAVRTPGQPAAAAAAAPAKLKAAAPKPRAGATTAAAARPAVAAAARGPVGRMQAALATAIKNDPDWKEF
jgi:methyl-accepting chemotaxis protein